MFKNATNFALIIFKKYSIEAYFVSLFVSIFTRFSLLSRTMHVGSHGTARC